MKINLFDDVLLKNGQSAGIVEVLDEQTFLADIGDSPENWDTIDITLADIERIINRSE
ncbi:hypothetical protein KNP65_00045 [Latilactobacillus curvatus]|uniref:hypothetical protein n=1 Tax=Latilactobacillus curvatus TaxID=28038 RepID=UPI002410FB91|nr:hypothetical protein [Latilactobacillus curvatus]MDG2978328.1 hypothetical protein [Latilactobacillus curvatus]MDT3394612.1 hypothetical protein [Bacillota bacterium]